MANISDKLTETTNGTRPVPGKLTALRSAGAGSISVDALTGWPTNTAVHFIIYSVDTNNKKIAGSQTDWKGIVTSPTAIGSLTLKAGTDNGDSVGAIVEAAPTAAWADDLVEALAFDHEQSNGGHKSLHDSAGAVWLGRNAVASAVNYVQVSNSIAGVGPTIEAAGTDTNIDLNLKAKGTGVTKVDGAAPQKFFALFNFIESGCVWTADAPGSTRAASMTAGVVWIGGKRLTVAAVTARLFTASKDTYVDFADNGDGTAKVIYTETTNNAASPTSLSDTSTFTDAANVRDGIIVTGASNIANAAAINQGQENSLLPIASSVAYAVTDSLGFLIAPRDPNRKVLAYREITTDQNTSSSSPVAIPGLSAIPFYLPQGRAVKITFTGGSLVNQTVNLYANAQIHLGSISGNTNMIMGLTQQASSGADVRGFSMTRRKTLAAGAQNLVASFKAIGGGTAAYGSGAEAGSERGPFGVTVELV